MKGFKETDIGLIPEDWGIMKLGNLINIKKGTKPKTILENSLNGDYSVYLTTDYLRYRIKKFVPKTTNSIVVNKQDVIIIWDGSNAGEVFSGYDGILASTMAKLWPRDSNVLDSNYLYFVLTFFSSSIRQNTTGTSIPHVNRRFLTSLDIPLPPLEEQKAIAKVLDSVRETIEKTENVINALKEFKKSLMEHLFTYGAVPYDERDRVKLRQTEIGMIPKHWEVKKFGSLYEIQQGKALSRKNTEGTLYPFLRTSNIGWGKIIFPIESKMPFTEKEMEKLKLKHGDLLICEGGEVGRTAIWKYDSQQIFFQNHIFRARAISKTDIYSQFHMYWMQYAILLKRLYVGYENKTTIPNLSRRRLSSFLIPVPPIEEQKEIAEILDKVDSRIEAEERKKEALEELFKTLLNKLMTGKIRVAEEFLNEFKETVETENG